MSNSAGARSKNSAANHSTFQKTSELFSIGGGHVVPVVNNTTCFSIYKWLLFLLLFSSYFPLLSHSFLKKRSKYIYISTINANTSTNSLQNLKFTELRRNQYPPPHVPRVITPPIPSNATKIGNPTSQCALLGWKLVQLSTLAGRIFFCHSWKSSDGVRTELIRS